MVLVEPKVNLISSGAPIYAITQSKAADERLNIREEHKEVGRSRDRGKKIFGNQWAEELKLVAGITKKFSQTFSEKPQCSTTKEIITTRGRVPDPVLESGKRAKGST